MNLLLIYNLLLIVYSIDKCQEYRTQKDCILSTDSQCFWNQEYCEFTKNLQLGCSRFLNRMACIKQLSNALNEKARCIFNNACEPVIELSSLTCNAVITKHACLDITNIDQLCFWDPLKFQCNEVTKASYQNDFEDVLYSASVCSRIENYLVIHSSVIWNIISYNPDFVSESENIYKQDLGLGTQQDTNNYETGNLANNFVYNVCNQPNQISYFQWYILNDLQAKQIKNLKITDRKREGCIALQITDDDDYNLIFSKKKETMGVNKIYCRYQGGIFINYRCFYYEDISILRNSQFLQEQQINCYQLNLQQCAIVNLNCYPVIKHGNNEKQETCVSSSNELLIAQGCLSNTQVYQTHHYCSSSSNQSTGIYLDFNLNPPSCSSKCFVLQKDDCDLSYCNWVYEGEGFHGCIPHLGCNHPGLNLYYCQNMAQLCQWDSINGYCYQIKYYELFNLKCSEATSKFLCGNIKTFGEECIWIDEDLICLNVLTIPTLKVFESFPVKYVVNRELCMNQKGKHQYINYFCINESNSKNCEKEDPENFGKELCITSSQCYWNVQISKCEQVQLKSSCGQMINVSPDVCSQFNNCSYDISKISCVSLSSQIFCTTPGISRNVCLDLEDQNCQWIGSQCIEVLQFREPCQSYRAVTKSVCVSQETHKCQFVSHNCQLVETQPLSCSDLFNKFACQASQDSCYFTNRCKSFQQLNQKCEGFFLSKTACLSLSTFGEQCIWKNDQCMYITEELNCLSVLPINVWGCISISAKTQGYLSPQYYCQYNQATQTCFSSTSIITGCLGQSNFNIHRCSAQTTGNCIYKNYKCVSIDINHKYWDIQLGTINCEQANLQTCQYVKGRICQTINQTWNSFNDVRCGEVTTGKIPCSLETLDYESTFNYFQTIKSQFTPQVCAQLEGLLPKPCYWDSINKECAYPLPTLRFTCNSLGINRSVCLSQTYGQCAFVNFLCIEASLKDESCVNLNKWACLNSSKNCVQQNIKPYNVCQDRRIDLTLTCTNQDYQSCSLLEDCYAIQFKCYSLLPAQVSPTNCHTPQIGKSVCLKSSMYCQFFNSKCQTVSYNKCEYLLNLESCANNLFYNCVFLNNKCYTQNYLIKCDIYESTNYNFCRQFQNCKYNFEKMNCVDLNTLKDVQNNQVNYDQKDCNVFENQFDCLSQWQLICKYSKNSGCANTNDNPSECPHLQQYSKIMCQKYENCEFQFGYFCIDKTKNLNCSQLSESLCLQDISDNLACYWDGTDCQDVTTQICSDVQSFTMNYAGCYKISNQDSKKCMYQFFTSKCKILKEINNCSDFTTNIECATRANASCLLGNPIDTVTTCTSISNTFNINLNLYGCMQLTTNAYYYDIYNYQCKLLDQANYENVQGCRYLNKKACIEITSVILNINCGWIDDECQQLIDLTNLNDCSVLNKNSCINIETTNLVCEWNIASKLCYQSNQNACYVPVIIPENQTILDIYSLSLCSKGSNTNGCMSNSSNTGCVTFNYEIEICENMGLNKKACLEYTTGYCKWQNNQCQNSQFDNLNCNSEVNKNTCLIINDNLCEWNDVNKTCSIKTLIQCTDAINYNQCMNVPNQLCEYTDSKCITLEVIQPTCKNGYNKFACKNVQEAVCQFNEQKCSILYYVDIWTICSQYVTKALCESKNCEWENQKCISITICSNDIPKMMIDDFPYKLNLCTLYQPQACIQIYNKYGCFNSSLYCQWNDNTGCSSFVTHLEEIACTDTLKVNRNVCDKFAPKFCEFKIDSCSPRITDYYFNKYPQQTLASTEISHQIEQQTCDQYLTKKECILSTAYECYWNGSCQQISYEQAVESQNLNLKGCKKFNFQWRDRQCLQFTYVSNSNDYLDNDIKLCETEFISKQTCLNISAQPCRFDTNSQKCKIVIKLDQPCSFYSNVNRRTCQLLTKFSCNYNQYAQSCITAENFQTDLNGLSKQACLSLSIAAYWDDFCISVSIFECNQKYQSTSSACVLSQTSCIYDETKSLCVSQFNINAVFCNTLGVSSETCTQITREPCIFTSNKCQRIPKTYSCDEAQPVNEMACASLQQSCSYNQFQKKCQLVSNSQKCSTLGLSKKACLQNTSCQFNNDLIKCECSIVASPQICSYLSSNSCNLNKQCFFDNKLQTCRRKYCEDLSKSECYGQMDNLICYYTGISCQSASKCEDIFGLSSSQCQDFIFNAIPCIGTNNRCFTYNNYLEYCQNSDCKQSFCSLNEKKICSVKQCSALDNCHQLGIQCQILSNGTCIENQSCQFLDPGICDGLTIRTQAKCSLQKYNIYQDDVLCTSQICALYGISELCEGNQFANYTCTLVDQKCLPCEQINDPCQCTEKTEICIWKQNTCRSFQCNELKTQESCNAISRCLWSSQNKQCLIHCRKIINADECNSRTQECYYDQAINYCQTGSYLSPNLSISIQISALHQFILLILPVYFAAII